MFLRKDLESRKMLILGTATFALAFVIAPARGSAREPQEQPPLRPAEIIRTESFSLSLALRLQIRYTFIDPGDGDPNGSFGVRRARIGMNGMAYQRFLYAVQLELPGGSVRLLDAILGYRFDPMAVLWFGQRKAPFGRQQLTSSANLNFVDRTIVDARFAPGRQTGVMLTGQSEAFEYGLGMFNGTGLNAPNDNNRYMFVARAVVTPLGAYATAESAFDYPDSPRLALGVSGLRTTIGTESMIAVTRLGVEGAFKVYGLNVTGEFFREYADPALGESVTTTGWYGQSGYLLPNRRNEIALRYAVVAPDAPQADVIETGVAVSHYFVQHRAKIQADLRNVERKATGRSDVEFRLQMQIAL